MERDVSEQARWSSESSSSSDSESAWYNDNAESMTVEMLHPSREAQDCHKDDKLSCSKKEYLAGKDIQGTDWSVQPRSKDDMRLTKLDTYDNYLNLPHVFTAQYHIIQQHEADVAKGSMYYQFESFRRDPSHNIVHFQLRNLLWATSAFEYYYSSQNTIRQYNSLTGRSKEVLCVAPGREPLRKSEVQSILISTMCVAHDIIAVGGFRGELVVKRVNGDLICGQFLTTSDTGITNGLELSNSQSGLQLVCSNNDTLVRICDLEPFTIKTKILVPWPANWSTASPQGGKMLAIVGDDPVGLIVDASSGRTITELHGHLDYSFAAAWDPSGHYLATGNQDTTTRVWDIRSPREALHVLVGDMAAVRSLRYSEDGRYLAAAEATDFIHIYDTCTGYTSEQEIEFFGEICGMTFTPDDSTLMISLHEELYGGIFPHPGGFLQYRRPCATL